MTSVATTDPPESSGEATVVILAAGKGTRMRSSLPKVLHPLGGQPLIEWVLAAARGTMLRRIIIVVGHGGEMIRKAVDGEGLIWVVQGEQLGTGHAVAQTEGAVGDSSLLVVLSGDAPLLRPSSLDRLIQAARSPSWGAMAVADLEQPGALGRVVVDSRGCLVRSVETVDASAKEIGIKTVNAGFYALPVPGIFGYLRRVRPSSTSGEIYLPEALNLAAAEGQMVRCVALSDPWEAFGVNTPEELQMAEGRLRARKT